jgi:fluoride exporter
MLNYLLIGLGGALGAMARVGVGRLFPLTVAGSIPVQMLAVNVIGCFVMGVVSSWLEYHNGAGLALRYFLVSGFLGGFTTFSAFALEGMLLVQKQHYGPAAAYILLTVILCLAFFFIGSKLFMRIQ